MSVKPELTMPARVDNPERARAKPPAGGLPRWLLAHRVQPVGPAAEESHAEPSAWWKVMCLTGVDYFSTLAYLPAIAALAAGALSPLATLLIVALTLFGMLPMYRRVARESPHGQGSVAMLEDLLPFWWGKLFVLALLGFVATSWIITITLSAADASVHLLENPYAPHAVSGWAVPVTVVLLLILGGVFLMGFSEAVGVAIPLVAVFLGLNAVVVVVGLIDVFGTDGALSAWTDALQSGGGGFGGIVGPAIVAFPLLVLGLSGFETGVSMMPLVAADGDDPEERLRSRIRNTRKLLTAAAVIMSAYLITTSFVTTVLIPAEEFADGGAASGRALAYLAHERLGEAFGTAYDVSTILILWFAGASAMAGLINIVPRYLPRYGMAPHWARASRPLVLVFAVIAFTITVLFDANVEAQGGAYATGVLVLILSASVAVTMTMRRRGSRGATVGFGVISAVFLYTTVANIVERPDGVRIAAFFIVAIVVVSFASRASRSLELRADRIELDETARRILDEASANGEIRIIAHEPNARDEAEYRDKEREQRDNNRLPEEDPVIFLEVTLSDASQFETDLTVRGEERFGYRVLTVESPTVPNAIAALLLDIRDRTGKLPHIYFSWAEGNPLRFLLRYVFSGEGDIPPVTREVLRRAEPDPARRPLVHVG